MNTHQRMVLEFHKAFDCVINDIPTIPDKQTQELRVSLLQEEVKEFSEALESGNLSEVAKELADILYVAYGAAVALGLDMEMIFAEVHRSNMSKKGATKRPDGKIIKPSTYTPADIQPLIEKLQKGMRFEREICNACAQEIEYGYGTWVDRGDS